MNILYKQIIKPYENGEYTTLLRAKYLRFVNLTLLVIVPIVLVYNILFLEGSNLELVIPLVVLICVAVIELVLLANGKITLAAHSLCLAFLVGSGGERERAARPRGVVPPPP